MRKPNLKEIRMGRHATTLSVGCKGAARGFLMKRAIEHWITACGER